MTDPRRRLPPAVFPAEEVTVSPIRPAALVLALAAAVACGGGPTPNQAPPAADAGVASHTERAPGGPTLDLGAAAVELPATWQRGEPSSRMRLAEATVPGPAGDALLTVFFFGPGGGGGVEANIQRWLGQVAADGQPERDQFTVGDYTVHTVAVTGTLQPSGMGTGPSEPVPDAMLLGAVVEGPGGPWFFKLTGPAATVVAARPELDLMLRSIHPTTTDL